MVEGDGELEGGKRKQKAEKLVAGECGLAD